ncbi:MAG: hypothetical protein M1834_007235 [Cirrosporium novae-zelandiae]|nr:MAG: hypothetical protein M1834_007235 [Cirrosporium novae-zelandiae]
MEDNTSTLKEKNSEFSLSSATSANPSLITTIYKNEAELQETTITDESSTRSPSPALDSNPPNPIEPEPPSVATEPPYHVLTHRGKLLLVLLVSLGATFSPLSSNIYFPTLDLIADTLNISNEAVASTITIYMVAQGLAPSVWGPLADCLGRRQILIYTLTLYVGANIGLALSNNLAMLLLFRFIQAAGSSSTISIGAGVIADIAPPAERAGFIGIFAGVRQFSMAIGPVIGGLLGGTFGFRSIFWFLIILGGFATITIALLLPETLRRIAGNGEITLTGWRYRSLYDKLWPAKNPSQATPQDEATSRDRSPKITVRIFFEPLLFLFEKDVGCTLCFGAVIYTVWSMVTSSTTTLLFKTYGLSVIETGLCFLPNGIGCVVGSTIAGRIMDIDFKHAADSYRADHGLLASHPLPKHQLPRDFPLERARLAQLPTMVSFFIFGVLVYGWSLNPNTTLALPLIAQFVIGFSSTAVLNLNNTLTIDLYPGKGAGATAVNNLARCSFGAVGVALTEVALAKIGPGTLFLILACVVVAATPLAWAEWVYGTKWRADRMDRIASKTEKKAQAEMRV